MKRGMRMRKVIVWLIFLLLVGFAGAYAEEIVMLDDFESSEVSMFGEDEVEVVEPEGIQYGSKLVIGALTAPSGAFATDMWGNNTVDIDVRAMIHGYDTVMLTKDEGLIINHTVLQDVQVGREDGGGVVYVLTFSDSLLYNDGTPITARDYAFSLLLSGAPEIEAIGGTTQGRSHLRGYTDYATGEASVISGVRMPTDNVLVMYIDGSYLPYFYGHAMISMKPLPISVIAPGCEVRDDGDGIYIATAVDAAEMDTAGLSYTPGIFSAEMLAETMLDSENGYLSHPRKTAGPYSLVSYDAQEQVVTFAINASYAGNYEGQKPHIETVVFRTVKPETMVDDLLSGRVDLLNKMTDTTLMQAVMGGQQPGRGMAQGSYLRTGLAFLAFACEQEPASSVAVRRALAISLDKDELVDAHLQGSAMPVYGYYGLGQWMATYTDEGDPAQGIAPYNALEALETLVLSVDTEAADKLLSDDGWAYTAEGTPYAAGEGIRHREAEAGGFEPLTLQMAITEENDEAEAVAAYMEAVCQSLGIGITVDRLAFPALLEHYYRQEERVYDVFFMASNFNYIFDPYYDFNTADEYQGMLNTSGLRDEEQMQLALNLRNTPSSDVRNYVEKWMDFQVRFVEMMPLIPLYSNVYFDFYVDTLQGYDMARHASWAYALPYAYFSEDFTALQAE